MKRLLQSILLLSLGFLFSACDTLYVESRDHERPFPLAAYLTAEQRLLDSPVPFHIERQPTAHVIPRRDRRLIPVSNEELALSGRTWAPSNPTAPRVIYVDLRGQKAYVVRGDWVEAITRISSGRKGSETPIGSYTVSQKSPNHRSNLFGSYVDAAGNVVKAEVDVRKDAKPEGTSFAGSPMPNFLRLREARDRVQGVGFHAGVMPGYPASRGCIRLPHEMSTWLFRTTPIGAPVRIIASYPLPELDATPARGTVFASREIPQARTQQILTHRPGMASNR